MKNDVNRQFRLKSRPTGRIETSNFDFVKEPIPEPGPGEALVRVLYLSLDPTNRIWMSDMDQYMPPVEIGAVMRGGGIGVVVKSNSARYKEGDHVSGLTGWQDYCIADEGANAMGVLPKGLPVGLPTMLGACGMTGLTAYFGLLELGQPQPALSASPAVPTSAATLSRISASTPPSTTSARTGARSLRPRRRTASTSISKMSAARSWKP